MSSAKAPNPKNQPASGWPLAFRQARPGAAGWALVVAPGAVAGAGVGLTAGKGRVNVGRLLTGAAGGAAVSLLIARAVDEVRWRRSAVSLAVDEPDAALDLMQAIRAEGVRADMVRAHHTAGRSGAYALRYQAKDDRRVRRLLARQQG